MARVILKKDFKDGDKLYGQQLNNNFGAIEAALAAMNKIVWQDDPDDMVVTFRGTTEEINSREVIDGQLLYDTITGETYIDYGLQRISTGSGNVIFVGNTVPSNPATMIWINPDASINEDMFKYKYGNQWYTVGIKASDTLPIGTIAPYGGETAPTNWLICDGSAISRITYADLFSVIGTSFGVGDGSTTFNLPDLRSRLPLGKDSRDEDFDTIGNAYGEKEHTLTIDEIPSHSHAISGDQTPASGTNGIQTGTQNAYSLAGLVRNAGGSQSHNIVQPSLVTNYIIKAFQSVGAVGKVLNNYTESNVDTYSCNYVNGLETYSTSETRIGTWIDGKPIYRKVVTGTLAGPINHGLSNVTFVNAYGFFIAGSGNFMPLPSLRASFGDYSVGFYVTSTQVAFDKGNSASGDVTVVLEYTKTTD